MQLKRSQNGSKLGNPNGGRGRGKGGEERGVEGRGGQGGRRKGSVGEGRKEGRDGGKEQLTASKRV